MYATTTKATRRITAPATAPADQEAETFGELAKTIRRLTKELGEFADGVRGPVPEAVAIGLREVIEKAGDELRNALRCYHSTD